jgi:small subunit ribosomal protein S16
MLVIRLQRTGRKNHALYRVVLQNSQTHPSSGKVLKYLGSYNPHTKTHQVDLEKISFYINNGAQPSERVVSILATEKVKLPDWVAQPKVKSSTIKNAEKLRKNQPKEEVVEVQEEIAVVEEVSTPEASTEEVVAEVDETTTEVKSED